MINKTFLILLLASLTYTVYNAAAVSETFEISTTIDHEITLGNFKTSAADANLNVTSDIDMGTIYINPSATEKTTWGYASSGVHTWTNGKGIVRADNVQAGVFTADVLNPTDCNGTEASHNCAGLSIVGNHNSNWIYNLLGSESGCRFTILYNETSNRFTVFPFACYMSGGAFSSISTGLHTGTLTISYNLE
ncbi:MAG: hypothetical protein IJ689_01910 [Alphaproteobacteria bacterium]|nr:hypothetical protein [Alphaproteobacteria bacterium]